MEHTTLPSTVAASTTELEQVRQALTLRYPNSKNVLGAQLGALIRRHLTYPELKGRFGGLKNFVTQYFPTEITWRGRKGLDDLYDVCFSGNESSVGAEVWQPVTPEPSSWLWSSVTNPSTSVQFAWSPSAGTLMRASVDVQIAEGLIAVHKLSKVDYHNIARNFIASVEGRDTSRYIQALDSSESTVEFGALIREDGLLPKWEEFRVDSAVRLFADRLGASGADAGAVNQWADLLRSSQRQARSERLQKTIALAPLPKPRRSLIRQDAQAGPLETLAVATKALEFLSEAELSELRLPLGSVMRAFRSLISVD